MALADALFAVAPGQFIPEESPDWMKARLGRITASDRISRILGGQSAQNTVLDELEYELVNGEAYRSFSGNRYTRHGNDFEDQALSEYDMFRVDDGELIRKPGFTIHPGCQILGASPDFLIGDDIVGQVKCPAIPRNHFDLLYGGPGKYVNQIQCESLVTGRPEIVFISYHPQVPAAQQLHSEDVKADTELQAEMLETCLRLEEMLWAGKRFSVGKLFVEDGVPALF